MYTFRQTLCIAGRELHILVNGAGISDALCHTHAAVLDCANGHQKKIQEEVNAIEEKRRQEVAGEAVSTEAENS
jgi:hypothetical protein